MANAIRRRWRAMAVAIRLPWLGYSFAIRRAAAVYGLRPYAGFGAAISSPAPSASRFLAQKTPAVIGYCVRDIASMRYRFMMT